MPEPITQPAQISILILAAGASSRMRGADKLLEPVAGMPLLRRIATVALGTELPVYVTLDQAREARVAALKDLALCRVMIEDAGDGMGASLRAGISAIPPDHAALILLADMPEIDALDMAAMITAYRQSPRHIHRAVAADGRPGHPVVFPPWARVALLDLSGDSGAKSVLQAHKDDIRLVALPEGHATTDLDTPEDWAKWRAENP